MAFFKRRFLGNGTTDRKTEAGFGLGGSEIYKEKYFGFHVTFHANSSYMPFFKCGI